MQSVTTGLAFLSMITSGSVSAKSYDCALDPAQAIFEVDGEVAGSKIDFGDNAEAWSFKLLTEERTTDIVWPNSPIQLNGKTPKIQTSKSSFASFHVGAGPCMFTEGHCGALVHYSEQGEGSLSLMIQPIALTQTEENERQPFVVFLPGKCNLGTSE